MEFFQALCWLAAVFAINSVLYAVYSFTARHFGWWSPNHDHLWPKLPWREIWRIWTKFVEILHDDHKTGKGHTGGFLSVLSTLCLRYKPGDLALCRARLNAWLTWPQVIGLRKLTKHVCILATTGGGKSVLLALLLRLCSIKQAAFVTDPKGEHTQALVKSMREEGHSCHVNDPYGLTSFQSAKWNLYGECRNLCKILGEDVSAEFFDRATIADVEMDPRAEKTWAQNARTVGCGIHLHIFETIPPHKQNAETFRELLLHGYRQYEDSPRKAKRLLWYVMAASKNPKISAAGALMIEAPEKQRSSILVELQNGTSYMDDPRARRLLSGNDYYYSNMKAGSSDKIFMVAPTSAMREGLRGWFRSHIAMLTFVYERIPGNLKNPSFLVFDEFTQLGYLDFIEGAAPLFRGYGARLFLPFTDLTSLDRVYPNGRDTFLSTADVTYCMDVGHKEAKYISERLAKKTFSEKAGKGANERHFKEDRDVMSPNQVELFLSQRKNNVIVLRSNERPINGKRLKYHSDLPVNGYSKSPEFGDTPARAWLRSILSN